MFSQNAMLRVTVEMIPRGCEAKKHVICIGEIANNMEGDEERGDYQCWFSMFAPKTHEVWKWSEVKGFPRQKLGHWDLLYRALRAAVGYRNP